MVEALGNIPGDFMNFGYLMLKPFQLNVEKYLGMADILDDEAKLINFLRIEDPIYHTDTPQVPSFSSVFPPLSQARRSLSMAAKPALASSGRHRLL